MEGWALSEQSRIEEGAEQMLRSIAAFRATGSEAVVPYQLSLLAQAYNKTGKRDEGLKVVEDALTVLHDGAQGMWEAEVYQLKGELLMQANQMSKVEEAEACFHKALDGARRQSAKSMELRAATSLARLWQQQDKIAEARDLLAPVYNWFTEGFDTQDLKDAKALLGELAEDR